MKIAIATCAGREDSIAADTPLIAALEATGARAERCIWNDSAPLWHRFDAVIIRTTWDWHVAPSRFLDWIDRISARTQVLNAPITLGWGIDKRFLLELAASNVPIVPTLALQAPDSARVRQWAIHHGFNELVLKPSLSAGSIGVSRCMLGDIADQLPQDWPTQGVRLVQPYLENIETSGEVSLIFFDGVFSHAVRKTPKAGDYRIQAQYGGVYEPWTPDERAMHTAMAALAVIPGQPVLARIDMVHDGALPRVIEVEVVEPDLYFSHAPEAPAMLARALVKRIEAKT